MNYKMANKKFSCIDCNFNGRNQWALETHKGTQKHKNRNMVNILCKGDYAFEYYRTNSAVIKRQAKINYYKRRWNRDVYFIRESTIINQIETK